MKPIIFFLLIFSSASLIASPIDTTQSGDSSSRYVYDDITKSIASAIRAGNANALSSYFNSSIDLTVPGSDGTYSKSQAEMIVKNFFAQYPPSAFTIKQQGSSGEGSSFTIGLLETAKGNFRTYFLLKTSGGQQLIHQLQFEEE